MYAVSVINLILHEGNNVKAFLEKIFCSMIILEVLLQICNLQIDYKLIQPFSKSVHIQ